MQLLRNIIIAFTICLVCEVAISIGVDVDYSIGVPKLSGSGCNAQSASVTTSSDGQTFSILFSDYIAETSREIKHVRKACKLVVPITIGPGYTLGIFQVNYDGYVYVPDITGSHAWFVAKYFFNFPERRNRMRRYNAQAIKKRWERNTDEVMAISNRMEEFDAVVWSPCGMTMSNLHINTAITAVKRMQDTEDQTYVAIDSADVYGETGFRFTVAIAKCTLEELELESIAHAILNS